MMDKTQKTLLVNAAEICRSFGYITAADIITEVVVDEEMKHAAARRSVGQWLTADPISIDMVE